MQEPAVMVAVAAAVTAAVTVTDIHSLTHDGIHICGEIVQTLTCVSS